jgi:hypothetical protein
MDERTCPRCEKAKGRLTAKKYNQGVRQARCPRCKTKFWIWAGKGWLPEHEHVLKDALVAQMDSRLYRPGWWSVPMPPGKEWQVTTSPPDEAKR